MAFVIQGNISEGDAREIRLDPQTHAIIMVEDQEHHMHEGKHWFVKLWMDIDKSADPTSYMMFNTPPMPIRIHAYANIAANSEFNITIFRDAVISDAGTPILGQNNDQNNTGTHALLPSVGPTVSDEGIQIWAAKVAGGKSAGVSIFNNYEIIAKTESNYLYKIEKVDSGVNWLDVDFWWYEHISKETEI
jgi:hypothetical protein